MSGFTFSTLFGCHCALQYGSLNAKQQPFSQQALNWLFKAFSSIASTSNLSISRIQTQ